MNNLQSIIYWLRWILLLPLSMGTGVAVSSLLSIAASFVVQKQDLTHFDNTSGAFITSFLSVVLAHIIAPKYKVTAVAVLYSLWTFVLILCVTLVVSKVKLYGEEWEVKDGGIALSAVILGLTFSYIILFIAPKKNNRAL